MLLIFLMTDADPALRHIKPRSNTPAIDKIAISLLVPDLAREFRAPNWTKRSKPQPVFSQQFHCARLRTILASFLCKNHARTHSQC
jgi:hypothetical protein